MLMKRNIYWGQRILFDNKNNLKSLPIFHFDGKISIKAFVILSAITLLTSSELQYPSSTFFRIHRRRLSGFIGRLLSSFELKDRVFFCIVTTTLAYRVRKRKFIHSLTFSLPFWDFPSTSNMKQTYFILLTSIPNSNSFWCWKKPYLTVLFLEIIGCFFGKLC